MKKEITKKDYLCVIGLFALAKDLHSKLIDCESSLGELLGINDDGTGYRGLVSDELWGGDCNGKSVIKKLKIKIK